MRIRRSRWRASAKGRSARSGGSTLGCSTAPLGRSMTWGRWRSRYSAVSVASSPRRRRARSGRVRRPSPRLSRAGPKLRPGPAQRRQHACEQANAKAHLTPRQPCRSLECGVALWMAWELRDRPVRAHEEDRLTHELRRELARFDVRARLHVERPPRRNLSTDQHLVRRQRPHTIQQQLPSFALRHVRSVAGPRSHRGMSRSVTASSPDVR
jgi:hypothetical protein